MVQNWQACGTGLKGSFHASDGTPLINTSRFPDMKAMVTTGVFGHHLLCSSFFAGRQVASFFVFAGHGLGLKVGWYDNNCICGEGSARLNATQVCDFVLTWVHFWSEFGQFWTDLALILVHLDAGGNERRGQRQVHHRGRFRCRTQATPAAR